jgi:hypothetical protein
MSSLSISNRIVQENSAKWLAGGLAGKGTGSFVASFKYDSYCRSDADNRARIWLPNMRRTVMDPGADEARDAITYHNRHVVSA